MTSLQVKWDAFKNYIRTRGVNQDCAGQPLFIVHFFAGIEVDCFPNLMEISYTRKKMTVDMEGGLMKK